MPYTIVAEVGSNWYRPDSLEAKDVALEHIRQAAKCGATAVKFQLFRADSLYSKKRAPDKWEFIKRFELPISWLPDLRAEARDNGLEFWVTPFSVDLARSITYMVDCVKIASGDITNRELLDQSIMFPKVCLSTGAATGKEVEEALSRTGGNHTILLYCISNYPANPASYKLDWFPYSEMADQRGISDHTQGTHLVGSAILRGYTVFEKHFAIDETPIDLPDMGVSSNPEQFLVYSEMIKEQFETRYRSGFGERPDWEERFWARRGPDGLRPAGEEDDNT